MSRTTFAGLGSRIAARTLFLFCISAIVPIVMFAFLADRIVSDKLNDQATDRLKQASKSYGLLLFDRLTQTEAALNDMAALVLEGRMQVDTLRLYESERFRVVSVELTREVPATRTPKDTQARDHQAVVDVREQARRSIVSLHLTKQLSGQAIAITAEVVDSYLWNADAVLLSSADICVGSSSPRFQHCLGKQEPGSDEELVTATWSLFLAPRFGRAAWKIVTRQTRAEALHALRSFERKLPIASVVAILIAALLSTVQIRRSHQPLALLTRAATLVARGRFHQRVNIRSNDEYRQLGLAFNVMSTALSRQFTLLRALARVDRMILSDPSPEVIVDRVLPSLPRLLRTRAVALVLVGDAAVASNVLIATEGSKRLELREASSLPVEALVGAIDQSQLPWPMAPGSETSHLFGLSLEVGGKQRGALIFGNPTAGRRARVRNARAFARRFAIAMGSDDRRQALIRQAYHDELTGLPNRRLFKERLEHDLHQALSSRRRLALVYIDLDRFKDINDSLGHSAGDALLVRVGDRLKATIRDTDTLARMGGDEFVIIATDIDRDPAHLLAQRLQAALREPIVLEGTQCHVHASIGLTVYPEDGDNVETLLRNADIAMYRAKSNGGGVATYFEEHMNRDAQQRLRVERRLRHALQNQELTLHYQPKINLSDGSLHGVEALARWTDEELGPVSPDVFIPIAEESGLIATLGRWALLEACNALVRQAQAGIHVGHVSVNVSMHQLNCDGFVNEVRDALRTAGLAPALLEIELTESAAAANPRQILALLAELKLLGVGVSIDDFGTGYSSMASLAVLPADTLKIDRSFVVDCAANGAARSVIAAVISMAHALGKRTVAEGVETLEQLHTLRALGCDCVQGYLTARPMPESALSTLPDNLTRWREIVSADDQQTLELAS